MDWDGRFESALRHPDRLAHGGNFIRILADPQAADHLGRIRAFGLACDDFHFAEFQDAHMQRFDADAFAFQSQ